MESMFTSSVFNHPIEKWDVSCVKSMREMFRESSFNMPLGRWKIDNLRFISRIFEESRFNKNLWNWVQQRPDLQLEKYISTSRLCAITSRWVEYSREN
jgi:hypothetical protein